MDRVELNPVRSGDVRSPKRAVVVGVSPNPGYQAVGLIGLEIAFTDIEPIFFYRCLFGGVEVDPQIPNIVLTGERTPVNQRRIELHTL